MKFVYKHCNLLLSCPFVCDLEVAKVAHAFQAIGMNEHMINCVQLLSNTEKQKELLEVSIIISKCVYTTIFYYLETCWRCYCQRERSFTIKMLTINWSTIIFVCLSHPKPYNNH